MAASSALDLISTPVPVLHAVGLRTDVGVSGDDPLSERHSDERYRVFLTTYDPNGVLADRTEVGDVGSGQRRMIPVSDMVGGAANTLAVIHRVPWSVSHPGQDPAGVTVDHHTGAYDLYRSMLQLSVPGGGSGSVIYETPPALNDTRVRARRSSALMFASMARQSPGTATTVCVLYYSLDPHQRAPASVRLVVLGPDGAQVGRAERVVSPFTVLAVPLAEITQADAGGEGLSVVGWSRDAALIFLFLQISTAPPAIAVEHTHPPQTYLISELPRRRYELKDRAIAWWDEQFERGQT